MEKNKLEDKISNIIYRDCIQIYQITQEILSSRLEAYYMFECMQPTCTYAGFGNYVKVTNKQKL